ncbi:MAG: murein L,D-transpeptidase YcbB/YkuD [Chitinophagales bacterium]|jgi:murein L,D-transpeptidase YcbB/YkuD
MILVRIFIICLIVAQSVNIHAQISIRANLEFFFTDSAERFDRSTSINFPILDSLYRTNNFKPLFSRAMSGMYLSYLKEAEQLGFDLKNYDFYTLDSLHYAKNASAYARFDFVAADSYLLILADITNGLLKSENTRGGKVHFPLITINPFAELERLSELPTLNFLKLAEPQILSYQKTKEKVLAYQLSRNKFGDNLLWIDSLKMGDRDSLVVALRKRLYVLGDYTIEPRMRSLIFNKELASALQLFQERNLLDTTGVLDEKTVQVLNKPISYQIEELQLNLERWRWVPNYLGEYYALANLPAFEMSLVKNDSLLLRQKIVCGKVSRSTPSFYSIMSYMDINPTWTVPPTILQKDILPAVKRSSTYLSRTNMKVLDVSTGKFVNASEINWANASNYKFIQGPGLSNSLGVMKFIFPNNYYIFFHDTPHKEHFPLPVRAYSSGCIRLSQPREFAEIVLSYNDESFTLTEIDSVVNTQKTTRIKLKEQATVYVHYLTHEYVNGLLYNYPDIYGYNKEQLKFLRN